MAQAGVYCGIGAHDRCARPSCGCVCHTLASGKRFLVHEPVAPLRPDRRSARARRPERDPADLVSCPDCGKLVTPQGLGAHGNSHKTFTDAQVLCGCGYRAKMPQGLPAHRRKCDGRPRVTV